ncbi:MAG: CotH kinase family protein [Candidatus Hatepunaea meridiana]|nr:CotH kinase family protein [Candidatus Hatepunaea meridiana]
MKFLFIIIFVIFLPSVSLCNELVINELLARNDTTVADQDNEYDDWIELYNNSANPISLNGYYLSDNETDLAKWAFPDTFIYANDYLIIWSDIDGDQTGLHSNFRLSGSGEAIYLIGPDTMIIDSVAFGVQATDISYGRFPNGTGEFKKMYPTFSAPNNGNDPGREDDPSEIVFCDTIVHNYELHFYIENWEDTLKHYFETLNEEYIPAELTYNGTIILDSIGVRYKGNSSYIMSRHTPKKPFKFRFDKYKNNQTLFGIERLNFSNCINDPSFMREKIGYDIARCYMPAPRTAYANLYIEGELIGFYVQVEQIDELFIDRYFDNNRSNLYKANDNGATMEYRGADQADYESEYDLKTNEVVNDWSGFITMIDKLNNIPDADFVDTIQDYLNLDNCIRHIAFNMVLSHFDSYTGSGRNFYLYDDQTTGQFNILTWDINETFGVYKNNWNVITQDVLDQSNINQRPLIRRILENDSLKEVYLDYINDMITGAASCDSVAAMVDMIKPFIDDYVLADNNKLYSYGHFVDNTENDVIIGIGRSIPGLKSFSRARNSNLFMQLYNNDTPSPVTYLLDQNYPNPFNPRTTICFSLLDNQYVTLTVYNVLGQVVFTPIKRQFYKSGQYRYILDASRFANGIYIYHIETDNWNEARKMTVLK